MATAEKPKRGFFGFYRLRFKSKEHSVFSAIVAADAESASSARKSFSRGEDTIPVASPAVSLARKTDYYGEEKIKALVSMSPVVYPRKASAGKEEEEKKKSKVVMENSRKSVSHVETNLVSVVGFLQVTVLVTDMPGSMQIHAFRSARRTYDASDRQSAKVVAHSIKKEFDRTYGPAWHCVVGSSFGSYVTHSTGCFLYFSMEKLCVLLFKTRVIPSQPL